MTRKAKSAEEREAYLHELGIGPVWKLRGKKSKQGGADDKVSMPPAAAEPRKQGSYESVESPQAIAATTSTTTAAEASDDRAAQIARMDWAELKVSSDHCTACDLCKARKQAVLGVGDVHADWLFVGEGPGAEEDERGEPFVGQAGKLLDAMLAAIDLKRGSDVYIANSVKCRPPNNRTPEPAETAACRPYLQRQIALLQPKLIVALGRPAAQTLLGEEVKISAVRGKLLAHQGIPLIVTYHPAYLLRNLPDKAKSWEDLTFARRTMQKLKENSKAP